jgi:lysylphosphatidylglycerol synthetase-like protein (DUF2156 family)
LKENIPLSWSHKEIESPKFHSVNLSLSGLPWVHTAEIPATYNIDELRVELETSFPGGFLLRGCSSELAGYLNDKGFELIRTGAQGIVDLENLNKLSRTVTDLVRRGDKQGRVKEISLSENNRQRVSQFIAHTSYGSKPHLRYLFNDTFDSNGRCFVLSTSHDRWLGVLSVSLIGDNFAHTEMILRNKKAQAGVMESLFVSVMNVLRDEGFKHFSLGEVPFVSPEGMKDGCLGVSLKQSLQESFLFKAGHILRFAYNYKGLFDFKNKFDPEWKPVYICATPKLPFFSLIDLFCKTGYLDLSRSELIANIKSYSGITTNAP